MTHEQMNALLHMDAPAITRELAMYGVCLQISNGGHHWRFYEIVEANQFYKFAEWWPSSGKLALDRDYKAMKRVNDWPEAEAILWKFFKLPPNPGQRVGTLGIGGLVDGVKS